MTNDPLYLLQLARELDALDPQRAAELRAFALVVLKQSAPLDAGKLDAELQAGYEPEKP